MCQPAGNCAASAPTAAEPVEQFCPTGSCPSIPCPRGRLQCPRACSRCQQLPGVPCTLLPAPSSADLSSLHLEQRVAAALAAERFQDRRIEVLAETGEDMQALRLAVTLGAGPTLNDCQGGWAGHPLQL